MGIIISFVIGFIVGYLVKYLKTKKIGLDIINTKKTKYDSKQRYKVIFAYKDYQLSLLMGMKVT